MVILHTVVIVCYVAGYKLVAVAWYGIPLVPWFWYFADCTPDYGSSLPRLAVIWPNLARNRQTARHNPNNRQKRLEMALNAKTGNGVKITRV